MDLAYWFCWWGCTVIGVGFYAAKFSICDEESCDAKDEQIRALKQELDAANDLCSYFKEGNRQYKELYWTEREKIKGLEKKDIDRLILLCHPDKHDGKKIAVEMTQKLLSMR